MLRCGARRRNPARFGERGAGNVFRRGGKKNVEREFCWVLLVFEEEGGRKGWIFGKFGERIEVEF